MKSFFIYTLFAAVILTAAPSFAAVWYVAADAPSGGDGTSWETAFNDLEDGLDAASAGDQIWVKKGTYIPSEDDTGKAGVETDNRWFSFQLREDVALYGGFEGDEDLVDDRDIAANPTILSGDLGNDNDSSNNCYSVVAGGDGGTWPWPTQMYSNNAVIDGFTIQDGTASNNYGGDSPIEWWGGGMSIADATGIEIRNCYFKNNSSETAAGAFSDYAGIDTVIDNCVFDTNSQVSYGAVKFENSTGTSIVRNCTIINNSSVSGMSGGLYFSGDLLHCKNNVIYNNSGGTGNGGGVYINTGTSLLVNNTIFQNSADMAGGIYYLNGSHTLKNTIVYDNVGTTSDDEIYNSSISLTIAYSDIGGGIATISGVTNGGGNIDADPLFADETDIAGLDAMYGTADDGLRLKNRFSPCIKAGIDDADMPYTGLTGIVRNNPPEMGAYETAHFSPVYVNQAAASGGDGTSWDTPFKTLDQGLDHAQQWGQVWVAKGTYYPIMDDTGDTDPTDPRDKTFTITDEVYLYGGFSGTENLVAKRDGWNNRTIFSGDIDKNNTLDSNNAYTVLKSQAQGYIYSIEIMHGYADNASGDSDQQFGGGVYCASEVLHLYDCYIHDNAALIGGGVLYDTIIQPASIYRCVFQNNTALSGTFIEAGGGLFCGDGGMNVYNSIFLDNYAGDGGGAVGVMNDNWPFNFINCTFYNNDSGSGTGSVIYHAADFTLTNCIVWDNSGSILFETTGGIASTVDCCIQGINPDPLFADKNNPKGPDGIWATDDDGLMHNRLGPCYQSGSLLVGEDIRGLPRSAAASDLGAYQQQTRIFYVDDNRNGDGTSWASAYQTIKQAFSDPEYLPGDSVWVAAGTYYATSTTNVAESINLPDGAMLYGGFAGNESDIDDRDIQTNLTLLSGDINHDNTPTGNTRRIVVCAGQAVIDGITIAYANNNNFAVAGGLYTNDPLTMRNCIIRDNQSDYDGAGVYCELGSTAGDLIFENCVFSDNRLLQNMMYGAGMCINASFNANAYLDNCVFYNNTNARYGGGLYLSNNTATINHCTFVENQAVNSAVGSGGGLYYSSNLTINNSIFWNNTSDDNTQLVDSGTPAITQYCLVEGGYGGTGIITGDPMFVDQANPAGDDGIWMTADDGLLLQGRSYYINPGNSPVDYGPSYGLMEDILGTSRTYPCELGAYEGAVSAIVYVNPNAAGADDGTSWADAYTDLADALWNEDGYTEFWVAKGTYYPVYDAGGTVPTEPRLALFFIQENMSMYGGFAGNETMLSQRNSIANPTVLDGDIGTPVNPLDNAFNVAIAGGGTVVLDGLTIRNGNANGDGTYGPFDVISGGLLGDSVDSLALKNVIFENNFAAAGAGAYLYGVDQLLVSGCVFRNNTTSDVYSFGLGCGGGLSLEDCTSVVVKDCLFEQNTADNGGGGIGVIWGSGMSLAVDACVFDRNSCTASGGGLYLEEGFLQLQNSLFIENQADNGGAIYCGSSMNGQISNNTVYDNQAFVAGGGVYLDTVSPSFYNNIIWNNNAVTGTQVENNGGTPWFSGNCIEDSITDDGWDTSLGNGNNNIDSDPKFVDEGNPAGPDGIYATADDGLQVIRKSPCVEGGYGINNATDLLGNHRPWTDYRPPTLPPLTIGAYEWPVNSISTGSEEEAVESYFGKDAGCTPETGAGPGMLSLCAAAVLLCACMRRLRGRSMMLLFAGLLVLSISGVQAQDDAPLLFDDMFDEIEDEAHQAVEDARPDETTVSEPDLLIEEPQQYTPPVVDEMFGIKPGISFGIDLSMFAAGGADEAYSAAFGFGLVLDYGLNADSMVEVAFDIYSPQASDADADIDNSIMLLRGLYIKQDGKLLYGGGGGFATNRYDDVDGSGTTRVMVIEGMVGYIAGPGRISASYIIPTGSDNVSGIISVGYKFLF